MPKISLGRKKLIMGFMLGKLNLWRINHISFAPAPAMNNDRSLIDS